MDNLSTNSYVGRAGFKLDQANSKLNVNFKGKSVLDIGSSTGGFSDYALRHGASRVIAVELGTNQMADSLKTNKMIELHEKTDILDVLPFDSKKAGLKLSFIPDIVLIDLSFVSLRKMLPHIYSLVQKGTNLIVLVKPQFEAESRDKNNGIIKNEAIRRQIFKDFEAWVKKDFVVLGKTEAIISGTKGNKERFYHLIKA